MKTQNRVGFEKLELLNLFPCYKIALFLPGTKVMSHKLLMTGCSMQIDIVKFVFIHRVVFMSVFVGILFLERLIFYPQFNSAIIYQF